MQLQHGAEQPRISNDSGRGCEHHGADPDGIDVIEMRVLELDAGGLSLSGLLMTRSATSAPTQATATIE